MTDEAAYPGTPPTILVVDDDRALSRLVEKSLQREGFLTASAASFQEAIEWLQNHQPDLMLLDLKLEDFGGEELVDHLTVNGRSVPFIIITGQGDERVAVAMMKRGALDYLVKDVDFLQFVPEVARRALGQLERDRKLVIAEEALRRSEANLARAQQIAHFGSYELSVPWSNNNYRSEETLRILGIDSSSGKSSVDEDVERRIHPLDRERYRDVLDRSVREAAPFNLEYRIVRSDGSVRHVQSQGEPVIDHGGKVVKIVGTLLDITDRKRAEEALRKEHAFSSAILDTSGALVVVLDRNGGIIRFNRACEETTGYSANEVKGRTLAELFLLSEDHEFGMRLFDPLESGHFPNRHETSWKTRHGTQQLIAWSNSALVDDDGLVEYVLSIGIDITERRRLEREILQISEMEQRRIGQDLHDGLCQHLAATELMSQILEQKLAKKSRTDAARVAEISRQVREAISQTRLLSRGLSPVVVESEGLMSALQELAAYTEKMFRVGCTFSCPSSVLVHDHGVATHLYRIAQEAISNGVRHGHAKQIDISLALVEGDTVLAIRDNGIGLPRDLSKSKGMGLRIMRYRAAMIGGSLTVQPEAAGGSSVTCSMNKGARPEARIPELTHHDCGETSEEVQAQSAHH